MDLILSGISLFDHFSLLLVAKRPKTEVPDSPQEVAYVGYIIDSGKEEVVLEPQHSIRWGGGGIHTTCSFSEFL